MRVLVTAGEASGDLYAAGLVQELKRRHPEAEFFGCTGVRLRAAGVDTVVDAASLAVVGLVEVLRHIPRIYGEFQKLIRAVDERKPDLAILTDSPDFNLRVAKQLHKRGIPVVYLVAPQVWAWRKDRLPMMQRVIEHLLCLFPFEQGFFREHGIAATHIGHPLVDVCRTSVSKEEFCAKYGLDAGRPVVTLLPGSRAGEVGRHFDTVLEAGRRIRAARPDVQMIWATPAEFFARRGVTDFRERIGAESIKVIEGDTWNAIGHADLALPASGTVTVESAILGTPMVTYYRVTMVSWLIGKLLVRVPYYSMPNLIAGRLVIPELMQQDMKPEAISAAALRLLEDSQARTAMVRDLRGVTETLRGERPPFQVAADLVEEVMVRRGILEKNKRAEEKH